MFINVSEDGESWKAVPLDRFIKTLVLQHIIDYGIVKSDIRRGPRDSFRDWEMEGWDITNWEHKLDDIERQLEYVEIVETSIGFYPDGDYGREPESVSVLQAQGLRTLGGETITMMVEGSTSEVIADIVREMMQ